jgi:hypothetical protein
VMPRGSERTRGKPIADISSGNLRSWLSRNDLDVDFRWKRPTRI